MQRNGLAAFFSARGLQASDSLNLVKYQSTVNTIASQPVIASGNKIFFIQ
jgi:hypothetical protein